MTSYRDAAVALWGPAGGAAHDSYARWLHLYPELPESAPIAIGITAYGKCAGLTRCDWKGGPRISIASNAFARGIGYVDDVMVHEMLHAWLAVTGRATDHDSAAWYDAIRRLSPAVLGCDLDVRHGSRRKSERVPNPAYVEGGQEPRTIVRKRPVPQEIRHADIARWPTPFRPEGYDFGSPVECPSY
jgi:hypothetical protein